MKKYFLMIVVALMAMNVSAQNGFGLMAGVNSSTSSTKDVGWSTGGFVGALYDIQLSGNLFLQPRLVLSYQENESKDKTWWYSQWAATLPVLASWHIGLSDKMGLNLNAGPYLRYAAFGRDRYQGGALGWWHGSMGERLHVGVQAGAQVTFGKCFATFDFKHALKRSFLNVGGFENTVQVGVGYKF